MDPFNASSVASGSQMPVSPTSNSPEASRHSIGPVVGAIIIIMLLAGGGLYYFWSNIVGRSADTLPLIPSNEMDFENIPVLPVESSSTTETASTSVETATSTEPETATNTPTSL